MFYDNRPLQSHNALLNMTDGARNIGKTFSHKIRAVIRMYKHGKKYEWLRYFRNDVKTTMKKKFITKKIISICNAELNKNRDPNKKPIKLTVNNFRQEGNFVYFRKTIKDKWDWFISVNALSDEQAIKSSEDPDTDSLLFEEYRITPEKLARYHGDPVTDFLSIWVTIKRAKKTLAFLIGNKESISDPIKSYFGIKPLDKDFQGIKLYKEGTIAVEQINDVPDEVNTDFDKRFQTLLKGTSYGNFLYGGDVRTIDRTRLKKKPKDAVIYCCFDVGIPVTAYIDKDSFIYFAQGIDKTRMIACDVQNNKYNSVFVISGEDKTRFSTLARAYKCNMIYFTDGIAYEQGQRVLRRLNILRA